MSVAGRGAPPSYIGFGRPPPLEEFLKSGESGVLLLDEFEKANEALHRLFQQAFDAGRLTLSSGKALDLSKLVIIATANVLAPASRRAVGFLAETPEADQPLVPMKELKQVFSRELLNRFDEVVAFRPLDRRAVERIVLEHILPGVQKTIQERYGARLEMEPAAVEKVALAGHARGKCETFHQCAKRIAYWFVAPAGATVFSPTDESARSAPSVNLSPPAQSHYNSSRIPSIPKLVPNQPAATQPHGRLR